MEKGSQNAFKQLLSIIICRIVFCMYELSQTAYDQTLHRHHNHHNNIVDQWIQRACYDSVKRRSKTVALALCMELQECRFQCVAHVACRKIRGKFFECFAHKQTSHIVYLVCCSCIPHAMHFIQVPSKGQPPNILLLQIFATNNNNNNKTQVTMNDGECVQCTVYITRNHP